MRTSRGRSTGRRASIRFAIAARLAAAASTNSSACAGTQLTRLVCPGACPERPARCSSRATPLGLPICSTRSTGEKSTPRSRLEVATTAFSRPPFNSSSTHRRTSASREPWCSATSPAQSGRASRSAWYQVSACERVLVKTSVARDDSSAATTSGSIARPRWPAHGKRSTSAGMSVSMTTGLSETPRTTRPGAPASSRSSASSRFPRVAESPQVRRPGFQRRRRASASSTCTPRLLPRSSCHSSTMTARTVASLSRASACESISERLSGVVTSAVGSFLACFARSAAGVSPVRMPIVQASPAPAAAFASDWTVSPASARMGVIHRTRSGGALSAPSSIASARGPRNAASVFPVPVAECTSPDSPDR